MPVFDYQCDDCSGRFEEVILCGEAIEESLPCVFCTKTARKVTVYSFSAPGLEDHQLESMEKTLFTRKQRAAGYRMRSSENSLLRKRGEELRFTSHSQLRKYEDSKGWNRLSPGTVPYKREMDKLMDEDSDIRNFSQKEGSDAVTDMVTKRDICEKTGWSSLRYDRWKNLTDKVSEQTEVSDG